MMRDESLRLTGTTVGEMGQWPVTELGKCKEKLNASATHKDS